MGLGNDIQFYMVAILLLETQKKKVLANLSMMMTTKLLLTQSVVYSQILSLRMPLH